MQYNATECLKVEELLFIKTRLHLHHLHAVFAVVLHQLISTMGLQCVILAEPSSEEDNQPKNGKINADSSSTGIKLVIKFG